MQAQPKGFESRIERLRRVMGQLLGVPPQQLQDDMDLQRAVADFRDYSTIATCLGEDRTHFYKWFHDVFSTRIAEQLTEEDKALIRLNVEHACKNQLFMDAEYQNALKALLSRNYYNNVFTVFFNNAQRKYRPYQQLHFGRPFALQSFRSEVAKLQAPDILRSILELLERGPLAAAAQ